MLMFKRVLVWLAVFSIAVFSSGAHLYAGTGVNVERIDESKLDELINGKNKKIVMTFMAAWCKPCIDELPTLNKLYLEHKDQGLRLIGISIDLEGPEAMQPILSKLQVEFPVYWLGDRAVQKFKLNIIPILFFMQDGQIVEKLRGQRSEKELRKKIGEFLRP